MEETNNNEQTMHCEESDLGVATDLTCSCQPEECDCTKPAGRKAPKAMICLAVLLAVVSIVGYKTFFAAAATDSENNAYSFVQSDVVIDQADQTLASQTLTNQNPENQNFGESLESFNDLNVIPLDNDAVFIFVPGSGGVFADDTANAAVLSAQQSLERNNISLGLYTLPYDSLDYSAIADQVETPSILVACKGGSMTAVSCKEVSSQKLLQAYFEASCCDTGSSCCDSGGR
jgi:hypothetical protein